MNKDKTYLVTFSINEIPGMTSIFPFRIICENEKIAIRNGRNMLKSYLNIDSTKKYKVSCEELIEAPRGLPLKGRRKKF